MESSREITIVLFWGQGRRNKGVWAVTTPGKVVAGKV